MGPGGAGAGVGERSSSQRAFRDRLHLLHHGQPPPQLFGLQGRWSLLTTLQSPLCRQRMCQHMWVQHMWVQRMCQHMRVQRMCAHMEAEHILPGLSRAQPQRLFHPIMGPGQARPLGAAPHEDPHRLWYLVLRYMFSAVCVLRYASCVQKDGVA